VFLLSAPFHPKATNRHWKIKMAQDKPATNGTTEYGKNVANGLLKEEKLEQSSVQKLTKEQEHVLQTFRILIADLCQQFNGGHPGQVPPKRS
jgi:dihydroxyacetone synthase